MAFKIKDGIAIGTTNIFDSSANLLVNAPTATKLATAVTINGTSFDGSSSSYTITAAAGTLTGTTLNSSVVSSSLTSVGTITSGTWNGNVIAAAYLPTGSNSQKGILQVDGTTIVATSGVISYTLPTASTGTLGGVKVDGSSISVSAGVIQANASGLVGSTLASNILSSSLTSVGTLSTLSVSGAVSLGTTLSVSGNATVGGNLTVSGNINYTGTVTQNNITSTSGTFNGDINGFGALYAGVSGGANLANTVITIVANKNDYTQVNMTNKNAGNQASGDFTVTSPNGSDTYGFIDMGITNSSWDGTQGNSLAYAVGPNDGYLYVQGSDGTHALTGGNLVIGTGTSGYSVKFNIGGLATTSSNPTQYIAAVINAPSTTSSSTTTGTLVVTGGAGISGAINSASITTTGNAAINGGSITTTASTANIVNTNATTVNIGGAGTTVSIGAGSGTTTVNNNLVVTGTFTVNGNTETINATTIQVADKNIELGKVASPTDTTADGGGFTLHGTTDKTIIWDNANSNWTSSEHWNIATGKSFKINNVSVLNATTLGSNVINSSLTSVGTIGTGVWNGTAVTVPYGGTGATSFTSGSLLKGAGTSAIAVATASDIVSAIGSTAVSNATTATNATNIATTGSSSTNSSFYIGFVASNTSGNQALTTTSALSFNPSTGALASTSFTGNVNTASINAQASGTTLSNRSVVQATVATTTATAIDTWAISTYRSAKYIVQVKQGTNYSVHEILVIHDGTTTYKTEYGVLETNGALVTFTSDISGGNARLLATMGSSSSATINISRELIVV
jgi:hypothetical protein